MTNHVRLAPRLWPALLGLVLLVASACQSLTTGPVVSTLAGTAGSRGSVNGVGAAARFFNPIALAVDAAGTVYVADAGNNSIRKVTAAGVVSTLAGVVGRQSIGDSADLVVRFGIPLREGSMNGPGTMARFAYPTGVAVDAAGTVYVADQHNHVIRKITAAGMVSTLAGMARSHGSADGVGSAARFYAPASVAVDTAGTVYVADAGNFTIRKVTAAGVVTTLAGKASSRGCIDSVGTAARFGGPIGIAVDTRGTVYVADVVYHNIRKITAAGVVSTLAGRAGAFGSNDGPGASATFNDPMGLAVDAAGTVYVADAGNHVIRKITAAGVVSTLAGTARTIGGADGVGAVVRFYSPTGVALGAAGVVYVADELNHAIRVIR
ncbi:NHL repeat-containing protein [Hymenobacter rigui]|uniref:SMP-30/Gluconolactonase/LRE-like region domain-containing protein n=1 Tax=Hymenobacter rigui TaxID=334424 RepID=A0A3R9NWV1_9BACT|nr:NHL repeat-containing protein [Hymenobacter rigui]RSK45163.1 hypothetical protein EI291_18810 [Hymenobacter rigui]